MTGVSVRKARREDMKCVLKLIKELAAYEKMESQVKIDEKTLERDGFDGDTPLFTCLVAVAADGDVLGYALVHYPYSTWTGRFVFLEDLYVRQEHRRRGTGTALFTAAARLAHDLGARFQFSVLSWNPASAFYERLGAVNLTLSESWHLYRMDMTALRRLCNGGAP